MAKINSVSTEPGSYRIAEADYHADPCPVPSLSRSTIMDLLYDCPRRAWFNHPRLNPDYKEEESEKFDIGKAAHAMLLEGRDAVHVVEADDWRTKAAKQAREEARQAGKIPLLEDQYHEVKRMVNHAISELAGSEIGIQDLHDEGESELSYIWMESGLWMRVRPDWISKDRRIVLDYKTTGASANPEDYSRIIIASGLDVQDAFYTRGIKAVDGTEPDFYFMVQETKPPYLCSFIDLDMVFREIGQEKTKKGISIWRDCMATDKWPGYPPKVCTVEAPGWAMAQWEYRKFAINQMQEGINE